jgi:hypothetical protein
MGTQPRLVQVVERLLAQTADRTVVWSVDRITALGTELRYVGNGASVVLEGRNYDWPDLELHDYKVRVFDGAGVEIGELCNDRLAPGHRQPPFNVALRRLHALALASAVRADEVYRKIFETLQEPDLCRDLPWTFLPDNANLHALLKNLRVRTKLGQIPWKASAGSVSDEVHWETEAFTIWLTRREFHVGGHSHTPIGHLVEHDGECYQLWADDIRATHQAAKEAAHGTVQTLDRLRGDLSD